MDRRTELCLDQPKPPVDARLRTLRRNRRSLRPSRNDSAHAQTLDKAKPLLMNLFFLDRLLMQKNQSFERAVRRYLPIWGVYANVQFEFSADKDAEVRVAFEEGKGNWAYIGADC